MQTLASIVERRLLTIAEMKVDGLVDWREERMRDAADIYKNAALSTIEIRKLPDISGNA